MTTDDGLPIDPARVVSDYWAVDRSRVRHSWLQHPVSLEFVNRRVSGDPAINTFKWFQQKYIPKPLDLCLSLGCGHGSLERAGIALGVSRRFHATDISQGAIEQARTAAAAEGVASKIEYSVADLDNYSLPAGTYDAIFASSSVHHVFQLERLLRECRNALKPGGLFFLDEYIGPSRFQTSPEVADIINRLRTLLPERHRRSLFTDDGNLIERYVPSPVEHFEKHDPSEAIRSGEIIPTLKMYFDIVEMRPYGGAIQHMLFSGIIGNFDEREEADVALLNVIATLEELLESAGAIQSDFAAVVATPRLGSVSAPAVNSSANVTQYEGRIATLTHENSEQDRTIRSLRTELKRRSLSLRWLLRALMTELRRRLGATSRNSD